MRLVDTREPGQPFATLTSGPPAVLDLRGRMPAGATAVALNLTTDRSGAGWVRAFPCNTPEPPTSNVNPAVGRVVTNAAIVPVGDGRICFTSLTTTDLVVDLNGWLTTSSPAGLVTVNRRLADTRTGEGAVSRLNAGATIEVAVTTAGSSTTAVALGVTAVDPSIAGFVTAWPCGGQRPVVSNLNPEAGSDASQPGQRARRRRAARSACSRPGRPIWSSICSASTARARVPATRRCHRNGCSTLVRAGTGRTTRTCPT